MDDLVKEFLVESYENLDQLDRDFVALETDPTAADKLGSIFRTIHTIKGTCGCLGFGKLEAVAHVGENLLSRLRDGQLLMDREITTGLLKLVDAIREILQHIEHHESEGDKDYSAVRQILIRLNERPTLGQPAEPSKPAAAEPFAFEAMFETPSQVLAEAPEAAVAAGTLAAEPVTAIAAPPRSEPAPADHSEVAAEPSADPAKEKTGESLAGNAIRVDVVLLDKLMNLVGELVLARNQVLQFTANQKDQLFLSTAQRLNLITTELQEGVMKTRMQPIGNLWNKFPRIVRDVANACNKKVRIEMEGRETELDKTIIEAIKDPLTHVIRNSVDHGVEAPAKRAAMGKTEEGRLFMRAFHEGGQVNIEISDDGNGIDPEIVKRKAMEKGLITAEQAARMSEREATNLIFLPGFSTAEKITNVSGRGVGMDVVKTNVEKIGGTVDVQSKVGEGTTLRIRIPLTLAIIPALTVTSGGQRFAIPQVSLLELVRLEENESGIEMINGTPVYRLRGDLLPLIYLNRELKIAPASPTRADRSSNIVVLRGGEQQFGLIVDQINDTEEIVVKPLGKQLKGIPVFAGATIMGDGKVALILDVMGLAQRANVIGQHTDSTGLDNTLSETKAGDGERKMLLLFNLTGGQRMAIPLALVARLEEFQPKHIEHSGTQSVVQYRGQIMPLVNVADVVGKDRVKKRKVRERIIASPAADSTVQVIVYSHDNQNIGLRVEQILDVVEESVVMQKAAKRPGVLGTAIIKDKITGLLDIDAVVRSTGGRDLPLAA